MVVREKPLRSSSLVRLQISLTATTLASNFPAVCRTTTTRTNRAKVALAFARVRVILHSTYVISFVYRGIKAYCPFFDVSVILTCLGNDIYCFCFIESTNKCHSKKSSGLSQRIKEDTASSKVRLKNFKDKRKGLE